MNNREDEEIAIEETKDELASAMNNIDDAISIAKYRDLLPSKAEKQLREAFELIDVVRCDLQETDTE